MEETPCRTWQDHEWGTPRLVETGEHPTLGRFNRYAVACVRCARETTRTDWLRPPSGSAQRLAYTTVRRD